MIEPYEDYSKQELIQEFRELTMGAKVPGKTTAETVRLTVALRWVERQLGKEILRAQAKDLLCVTGRRTSTSHPDPRPNQAQWVGLPRSNSATASDMRFFGAVTVEQFNDALEVGMAMNGGAKGLGRTPLKARLNGKELIHERTQFHRNKRNQADIGPRTIAQAAITLDSMVVMLQQIDSQEFASDDPEVYNNIKVIWRSLAALKRLTRRRGGYDTTEQASRSDGRGDGRVAVPRPGTDHPVGADRGHGSERTGSGDVQPEAGREDRGELQPGGAGVSGGEPPWWEVVHR
jgi:hypothetical protein